MAQVQDLEAVYPEWGWFRWLTRTTNPIACGIWLIVRVYLGWQWLDSGWGKVTGNGWLNNDGAALRGYADSAIQASQTGAKPPVAYGWWVDILELVRDNASWMAKIIPFVELIVGAFLILGLFTGIVAVVGLTLNFSFVLSGSAGVNPVFIFLGLGLLLSWRNAGWFGLDRWVLPLVGAPGRRGRLFGGEPSGSPPT